MDYCFHKYYKIIDFETFEVIAFNNKNTNYFKDKNHVYLDIFMGYFAVLEDADPNDFKVLDIENGYAISKINDYRYFEKIPFRLKEATIFKGESYQKVENQIYFGFREKMDADADTFEIVDSREWHKTVFKDKNHVYHKGKIVEGADPTAFYFLENCINEDKRTRYTDCDIHYYAKDKNYAYFINSPLGIKLIKTKDIEGFNFKVIDMEGYAYDKYYTY